jgi:hypothetical protein
LTKDREIKNPKAGILAVDDEELIGKILWLKPVEEGYQCLAWQMKKSS